MSPAAITSGICFKNILFATDFSSRSEAALPYAVNLSRRFGSTLCTVTVVPEELSDVQPPDPFYLLHSAKNKMASFARSELLEGLKHHELVQEGVFSEVLSKSVGRLGIDLVVLGTHGYGGVAKLLLGSLAEEIVGSVPCPVLTIGPQVSTRLGPELKLRRILCATNLPPGSAKALAYAVWFAEHEHARLALLHVLKTPNDVQKEYPAERDIAIKRLAQLLPPETTSSVETKFIIEIGAPAKHILRVAEEQNADLIVMGPHHTSLARVSSRLPWVTPHQVLCHAHCPVLTVQD